MGSRVMNRAMVRLSALAAAGGSLLILGNCDPTIQSTVESGIINVSTTALNSLMQAILQVYTQSAMIEASGLLARAFGF
jgi:hypothetical protein